MLFYLSRTDFQEPVHPKLGRRDGTCPPCRHTGVIDMRVRPAMFTLKATCPRFRAEADAGFSTDPQTLIRCGELRVLVLCDDCREYQRLLVRNLHEASPKRAAA